MKSNTISLRKIIISLFLLLPVFFVFAHGTGESLEKVVGDYVVDVGYDSFNPKAFESIRFDFQLLANGNKESVPFTDTWVRIMDGNNLLFAGWLAKPTFGLTGMSYAFPKGGIYEITVRFQNDDTTVAETSFPFSVIEKEQKSRFSKEVFLGLLIGLIVGVVAARFVFR